MGSSEKSVENGSVFFAPGVLRWFLHCSYHAFPLLPAIITFFLELILHLKGYF